MVNFKGQARGEARSTQYIYEVLTRSALCYVYSFRAILPSGECHPRVPWIEDRRYS